jgi:hypothetical protein
MESSGCDADAGGMLQGLDVPPCGVDTVVNRVVDAVTLPFAYWDSVHFLSLAERGWVLEKVSKRHLLGNVQRFILPRRAQHFLAACLSAYTG